MRLPTARTAFAVSAASTVLLLTAACGGDTTEGATGSDTSSSDSSGADTGTDADTYSDGTYEAQGSYANPGGESSVDVTLTVADNAVTEVEVAPGASGTSLSYQQQFIAGVDAEVVGKSLNDIEVTKVSGSSLTSGGFNEALTQIKSEAAA
ncbi:FMN-binding protein [Aeromicrobium sp. CF3.5]|uniref:FMN-binding protein n=1 Tax=Aeromicrobium sp. CF3.5 TaxID=3373078 RepID=UPI003EE6BBD9